ncbi:ribosomal-protein-alanine N-acetyltransferase [Boudabousia marimammalium]|uniref:[Ribosomal protein bS18]-alanine N-acetyltransferase n=2 Tax=Boudabousia marimammalium TaxID=156892 RepID=A0A1Q5PJK9_9ACTO|nr:ribosomal-protein-alanine N-acetyltransferase [Boudabousia marimammalium]
MDVIAVERAVFPTEAWSSEMLREELTGPYRFYVGVFDPDDTLVGYGGAMRMGDAVEIMTVGVEAHARGLGLGEALTRTLIESARESDCPEIFLEVRESSNLAQALYRKLGFVEIDRRPRYYHNPTEDAIIMRLETDCAS